MPLREKNSAPAAEALVAAASDLQDVLPQLLYDFSNSPAQKAQAKNQSSLRPVSRLRPVFGASGALTIQIRNGAPFSLFLSANEEFVQQLEKSGLTQGPSRAYAQGRLALLFSPQISAWLNAHPEKSPKNIFDAAKLLQPNAPAARPEANARQQANPSKPRITTIAIANPQTAPYGARAVEILKNLRLPTVRDPTEGTKDPEKIDLALAENVAQVASFVLSGAAPVGILGFATAHKVAKEHGLHFVAIPPDLHRPLVQRMALIRAHPSEAAAAFFHYLAGADAKKIFLAAGFAPQEAPEPR